MIPDHQAVSAYAFYNGLAGITSSKKRRLRKGQKQENSDSLNQSSEHLVLNRGSVSKTKRSIVSQADEINLSSELGSKSSDNGVNPARGNGEVRIRGKIKASPKTKANRRSDGQLKASKLPLNSMNETSIPSEICLNKETDDEVPKTKRKKLSRTDEVNDPCDSSKLKTKNKAKGLSISCDHEEELIKVPSKKRVNPPSDYSYIKASKLPAVEKGKNDLSVDGGYLDRKHRKKQSKTSHALEVTPQIERVEPVKKTKNPKIHFVEHSADEDDSGSASNLSVDGEVSEDVPVKMSKNKKRKIKKSKLQKETKEFLNTVKHFTKHKIGSPDIGKKVLETLLSPSSVEQFFKVHWEKRPLLIKRNHPDYFKKYLSIKEIDDVLRYNVLMFTRNIDITSYSNGQRETHNPPGRALPHVVWDYYSNGCSIRILNPQTYLHRIHTLLAALQEYFGCFVGSNVYLTPPNSQGFAPHYDDIEAFVLQIEGSKRWKVYEPRSEGEVLPRFSSPNFTNDEIGNPIIDEILEPGDLLYFPRGYIHQAETLPGKHSLHITLSAYQKTAWIDLMEKAVPKALDEAWKNHVDFRKGLPIGYLNQAGYGYPTISTRKDLHIRMKKLLALMENYLDVDKAVDAMGVRFMHEALPPVISREESDCSVYNGGMVMKAGGQLKNQVQLDKNTKIRLLRANCCRLVEEIVEGEGLCAKLYTSVENSKVFEEEEPKFLVIPKEMVPAVHRLMASYPGFIPVSTLPLASEDEKIQLASDLWDNGILLTDTPLMAQEKPLSGTDSDDN